MCRLFNLLLLLSLIPSVMTAQSYQISGRVTDSKDGTILMGVTVKNINRTNVWSVTSENGNYSIKANKGDTLSFSLLGMITEKVRVELLGNVDVVMRVDNIFLDEIVIIGYGSVQKKDLSGSVGQVKIDDVLEGNPLASINHALQGRLSGVMVNQNDGAPGAGISIQIRGANSFSTDSQPLFVIDGIPFDGASTPTSEANENDNQTANAFSVINPNDIESIQVLKDASATAIYGSRGANGVILITSKKGKKGEDKIEFSSNFSVSTIGKKVEMLDAYNYANYINEEVVNSALYESKTYTRLPYPGSWYYSTGANGQVIQNSGTYVPSPEDFLTPGFRTDTYGNKSMVKGTDWQDAIYQTGTTQEYNLSVSGGNDKGANSFSGNYLDQKGIIKSSGYTRYTLRSNIMRKPRKWLELGVNMVYTSSVTDFAKSNAYDYSIIRSALIFPSTYDPFYIEPETSEELTSWLAANPYVYVTSAKDELKTNTILTSSYAEFKLASFLKFRQNLGYTSSKNDRSTYYNRNTQEGRSPTNGKAGQSDVWRQNLTSESLFTFDKTFKDIHNLNVVAGFTYEETNYGSKSMSATNFPSDLTGEFDMSAGLTPKTLRSDRGRTNLVSMLTRFNYSYGGKYVVTFSFRRDGSSKFVEGNKFANFASGALAWRLSEEKFIKNLNVFDNLKLRASYGQTGNQGISPYQAQSYLSISNYPVAGSLVSGYSELYSRGAYNSALKWETTDQYNVGLDLSVFGNRFNMTFDYYNKKTNGLLQSLTIAPSTGFSTMWSNSGWVKNEGFEISGNVDIIRKKELSWNIDANISFNENCIGGLEGDQFASRLWYGADDVFIQRNGAPIGAIYGYVEDGYYDNEAEVRANPVYASSNDATVKSMIGEIKYRNFDSDPNLTNADRVVIGDTNPDYIFGITSNFKWKSLTFNFFIQGVMGNDILNGNLMDVRMANIGNIPAFAYNSRWTDKAREEAQWPKAISGYTRTWLTSDRYVEDGSYIRLKNLSIGYTLKSPFKGISSIFLNASASNLFTLTKYSWFDPDVNAFGGDVSKRGVDIYSYPSSRNFSLSLKLNF